MVQGCCVQRCPSKASVPSHKFPSNIEKLNKWKNSIKLFKKNPLSLDDFRKLRVCYLHFKEEDYKFGGYLQRKLKDHVIPSLNIPKANEIQHETDDEEFINEDNIQDKEICAQAGPSNTVNDYDSNLNNIQENSKLITFENTKENVDSQSNLTPKAIRLYCSMHEKKLEVSKKLIGYKRRLREAKKYTYSNTIKKLISSLSDQQRLYLDMQMRNSKFKPKERRFTLHEKILALSVYEKSGKCYKFLEKIFHLPSAKSLRTVLQKIPVKTGCNKLIKKYLREQVKIMNEKDKVCCLMWDVIILQPHINYNETLDYIVGFEDYETLRVAKYADRALVFMVKGIQKGWKFPIGYFFSGNERSDDYLIACIKRMTKILADCGLILVAYVCDSKRPNITAINKLKSDSSIKVKSKLKYENSIHLYGQDIIILYDPPSLFKELRNNLWKYDLELDYENKSLKERRFVSWKIIQLAYNVDTKSNSLHRLMPKLTKEHIFKKYIKRKNVKNAIQVFSKTVAGFIDYHTKFDSKMEFLTIPQCIPKREGYYTAETLLFFNQMFDSVNGSSIKGDTPLRSNILRNSVHHSFWITAISKLKDMHFVDIKTKCLLNNTSILNQWILTLQGFQTLWQILKGFGFTCLKARYLNLDSLENFFNSIQSLNFPYNNLTCTKYQTSFRILLLHNLIPHQTTDNNYETTCNGNLLFTTKTFLREIDNKDNSKCEEYYDENVTLEDINFLNYNKFLKQTILKKIIKKLLQNKQLKACNVCKSILTNRNNIELFFYKTYKIIFQSLPNVSYKRDLKFVLKMILFTNANFSFMNCQLHGKLMIELYSRYVVFYVTCSWCHFTNQILSNKQQQLKNIHPIYKKALKISQRNSLKKLKYF